MSNTGIPVLEESMKRKRVNKGQKNNRLIPVFSSDKHLKVGLGKKTKKAAISDDQL
ncbi:MAG TPA: hypothetical protein VK174_04475 [Chitinophagales bacterium]|nr:hypothetical protein [Chitinophagales bacterium]